MKESNVLLRRAAEPRRGALMRAETGDWIVVESLHIGDHRRRGRIMSVERSDGAPPYTVHWLDDGHESLFFPGPEAHIEPAGRHEQKR
ncbi:uncharacterized protein DUF1918 [Streptomyces sp. 846.5]|nr:uncharacterized protein DUF1918 [Streptomyces sp. 846.5]